MVHNTKNKALAKNSNVASKKIADQLKESPAPKKRGRPRIRPILDVKEISKEPKKRGRKPKNAVVEVVDKIDYLQSKKKVRTKFKKLNGLIIQKDKKDKVSSRKKLLTEEIKKQIVKLYKEGKSIRDVSEEVNLNAKHITDTLREKEVVIRSNRKLTQEQKNEIMEKYKNGGSLRGIAKQYSVNPNNVKSLVRRNKIIQLVKPLRGSVYKITEEQKQEIVKHYEESNFGLQKIGRIFGIANDSVERILRMQGVKIRQGHKKITLSSSQKDSIVKLYKAGMGTYKIHKLLKVSRPRIEKVLIDNGVLITKLRGSFEMVHGEKAIDLFKDGNTPQEISKELGITEKKVTNFLSKNKLLVIEKKYNPLGISEEQKKQILDLHYGGMDLMKISKKLGLSYFTTYKFAKLTSRELNNNREYTNLADALKEPKKVYRLTLTDKELDAIPDEVFKLTKLESLTIKNALIKEVPQRIRDLYNLRELDLSANIIDLVASEISVLKKLEKLKLSENRLKEIPREISTLDSLEELDLSYNLFQKVPSITLLLKSLKSLNFDGNEIVRLPLEIDKLDKLENLSVKGNKLGTLPPKIANITKLEVLDISNNKIEILPEEIIQLKKLKFIDLRENNLRKINKKLSNFLSKIDEIYADEDVETKLGIKRESGDD